jgi:hypothetical protein
MTDDIKNLDETETANIDDRSEPIRKRVEKITGSTSETFTNLADDADDTADTNIDEKKTVKYSEMVIVKHFPMKLHSSTWYYLQYVH